MHKTTYCDEQQADNSKKYKFQEKYYSLYEIASVFLEEENFELAQKHIERGYIGKYLEEFKEYDLVIEIDEQEGSLNKLIYFVYSINPNLDFMLYGRIINKEYLSKLLIKKIANNLSEIGEKIFNIISSNDFIDTLKLYEKLTNKKIEFMDFISKRDFSNLEKFLDIENIISSNDIELINLTFKFINIDDKNTYKIVKYLFENNYEIDESKLNDRILYEAIIKEDLKIVEFLLSKGIFPEKIKHMLINLFYKNNLLDKYLHIFDFKFFKNLFMNKITFEMSLEGHKEDVESVAISSDNKYVVSYSYYDNEMKIWDLERGKCLRTLKNVKSGIAISSDNKYIVYKTRNYIIKIWGLETRKGLRTLKGHKGFIYVVAITSDNRYIVSTSDDKTIKIWDLETGKCLKTLENGRYVDMAVITSDNKYIVSGSYDETIKIWDFEIGKCLRTLEGHNDTICALAISSDNKYIVSGSWDETIKIWDFETGKCLRTVEVHNSTIKAVAISSDNKYIVSTSTDETVKIWDLERGKCLETLKDILEIAITSDNRYIVYINRMDETIKIWDFETGKCLRTLEGHKKYINTVAITSDNRYIVSGSDDKTIKIWDLETGKCLETLKGHKKYINTVAITPDNRYIVSISADKTIKIWDLSIVYAKDYLENELNLLKFDMALKLIKNRKNIIDLKMGVFLEKDFEFLKKVLDNLPQDLAKEKVFEFLKINPKYTKQLFNYIDEVQASKLFEALGKDDGEIIEFLFQMNITPQEKNIELFKLLFDSNLLDKYVTIFDYEELKRIVKISYFNIKTVEWCGAEKVAITSDNKYIVGGTFYGKIKIWDLKTGEYLKTLEDNDDYRINALSITSDNRYIISGSENETEGRKWELGPIMDAKATIKIWDLETGKCVRTLEGHHAYVSSIAISSDDKYMVSEAASGEVKIWDFQTGECLKNLRNDTFTIAITSDNKYIAFGGYKTIRIFNLETMEWLRSLEGHSYPVRTLSITSDNRYIVSGSEDKTIKIWDLETGECLKTLEDGKYVNTAVLTSDNRYIVSGSYIWDFQTGECLRSFEENDISDVFITSDNRYIVSYRRTSKRIKIWELSIVEKNYLENKLNILNFDIALKLIKEDIIDLKIGLFFEKDFEFLKKVLDNLPQDVAKEKVFEFLKDNLKYTINLFNYIDKLQASKLLDIALGENNEKVIKFLNQKNSKDK